MSKKVIIDLKGALKTLKKRGITRTRAGIVQELNTKGLSLTRQHTHNWQKEAPLVVIAMHLALKHTTKPNVDFAYLMKKLNKPDKALDFLTAFCNETGLKFEDVVKEV